MQIPARTPVLAALTAATVDGLSGGRFALGLGVSNPDVSAGWYGVTFDAPLARTEEYVAVVRMALSGRPVRFAGRPYQLPPAGTEGAAHLRAAATRADLPIWLAAVGPASLERTGRIADGWIGVFSTPDRIAESLRYVAKGRAAAGSDLTGFEVLPSVAISVGPDAEVAADQVRGYFANFIGLGSRDRSIYHRLVTDLGYGAAADEIRDRLRAGDRAGAARAVPFDLMDATALLGPADRIAQAMLAYARAGVTTLGLTPQAPTVDGQLEALEVAARAHQIAFGSAS
jgi:alkanesulfonate monooxygenase SsuD/methylene tetrahydromethanopterin reductase-like flavin-dependent oxidoreductase (luciferase family)